MKPELRIEGFAWRRFFDPTVPQVEQGLEVSSLNALSKLSSTVTSCSYTPNILCFIRLSCNNNNNIIPKAHLLLTLVFLISLNISDSNIKFIRTNTMCPSPCVHPFKIQPVHTLSSSRKTLSYQTMPYFIGKFIGYFFYQSPETKLFYRNMSFEVYSRNTSTSIQTQIYKLDKQAGFKGPSFV